MQEKRCYQKNLGLYRFHVQAPIFVHPGRDNCDLKIFSLRNEFNGLQPLFIFIGRFYVTKICVCFIGKWRLEREKSFLGSNEKRYNGVLLWNMVIFV